MYNLQLNIDIITNTTKPTIGVIRTQDNAFIPFDPANTDYAEYLKWLAEGNTPQPAEQGTQS